MISDVIDKRELIVPLCNYLQRMLIILFSQVQSNYVQAVV
jgi:hypothetical protein